MHAADDDDECNDTSWSTTRWFIVTFYFTLSVFCCQYLMKFYVNQNAADCGKVVWRIIQTFTVSYVFISYIMCWESITVILLKVVLKYNARVCLCGKTEVMMLVSVQCTVMCSR